MSQTKTKIWGHRGCRGKSNPPENSLAAFEQAIKQGADGIELDVFLTKDNQLVVFHDDTLHKLTHASGPIVDKTLAELKQLKLYKNGGRRQYSDQTIPTLDEVLDLVQAARAANPGNERIQNFVVNIEIKPMPVDEETKTSKDIATPVSEAINKRLANGWRNDQFQVSSFDMESLFSMRKLNKDVPIGSLLYRDPEPWEINETELAKDLAKIRELEVKHGIELKPQTVSITLPSLTPKAIGMIKAFGAEPLAWTANERYPNSSMRSELGRNHVLNENDRKDLWKQVEGHIPILITDYPGEMRELLDNRGKEGRRY